MELFRLARIELSPSMSYHPQIDGQTKICEQMAGGVSYKLCFSIAKGMDSLASFGRALLQNHLSHIGMYGTLHRIVQL